MKLNDIKKRLEDYEMQPSYDADMDGACNDIKTLLDMLDEAKEMAEFYGKQRLYTNIGMESDLYDDQGKRARELLKKWSEG